MKIAPRGLSRSVAISLAISFAIFVASASRGFANDLGAIRGLIHDPQHRPIENAVVTLKSRFSDWAKTVNTDATGQFQFNAVALGSYFVSVTSEGFAPASQAVIVISGSIPSLHFQLQLASANEKVNVTAMPDLVATDSATPTTMIGRVDIERAPGARTARIAWQ